MPAGIYLSSAKTTHFYTPYQGSVLETIYIPINNSIHLSSKADRYGRIYDSISSQSYDPCIPYNNLSFSTSPPKINVFADIPAYENQFKLAMDHHDKYGNGRSLNVNIDIAGDPLDNPNIIKNFSKLYNLIINSPSSNSKFSISRGLSLGITTSIPKYADLEDILGNYKMNINYNLMTNEDRETYAPESLNLKSALIKLNRYYRKTGNRISFNYVNLKNVEQLRQITEMTRMYGFHGADFGILPFTNYPGSPNYHWNLDTITYNSDIKHQIEHNNELLDIVGKQIEKQLFNDPRKIIFMQVLEHNERPEDIMKKIGNDVIQTTGEFISHNLEEFKKKWIDSELIDVIGISLKMANVVLIIMIMVFVSLNSV